MCLVSFLIWRLLRISIETRRGYFLNGLYFSFCGGVLKNLQVFKYDAGDSIWRGKQLDHVLVRTFALELMLAIVVLASHIFQILIVEHVVM